MTTVDTQELDEKVQQIYRQVAQHPQAGFHFEMGRPLAERLGYPSELLDAVPTGAVESFAGVGYFSNNRPTVGLLFCSSTGATQEQGTSLALSSCLGIVGASRVIGPYAPATNCQCRHRQVGSAAEARRTLPNRL